MEGNFRSLERSLLVLLRLWGNGTIPKKGGHKVKGIYVQQIVELLNLEEWSDDDTESEEQAD
jgi:hypothetical protein